MSNLEVIARMKIREGQLNGFKAQAAEIVRLTQERDTGTLRCDIFVNEDGTECEVHERFTDEQALIEHKMNTMEPTVILFRDHAYDHHATLFGEVSPDLVNLITERMGKPAVFTLVRGLEAPAGV